MASARRYSPEQIVAKLRERENLQGQGMTIPQACKRIGVPGCRLLAAGTRHEYLVERVVGQSELEATVERDLA
jgi:hypothetical protein